jgi:mannose-6-phosphate isomerase class I
MGTHPKSPSLVLASGETLTSYLSKNQSLIGEKVAQKFGTEDGNLPFLFKVLAIEKALSIQSHPDKATAEKLHVQQPDIYKGKPTPNCRAGMNTEAWLRRSEPQARDGARYHTIHRALRLSPARTYRHLP